jgi:hypothetical protein
MANFALVSSYLILHEIHDLQVQIVENNTVLYTLYGWFRNEASTAYSSLTACLTPVMRIVCMTTGMGGMDTVRLYTAQNTPSNRGGQCLFVGRGPYLQYTYLPTSLVLSHQSVQ